MEEKNNQSNELKQAVLAKIEQDNICPHAKSWFLCCEGAIWFLWFLTTLIGAVAVTVSLLSFKYSQSALYVLTHDNFYSFAMEVLPFLWFFIFVLMVIWSVYNLRHTKHGYRYSLWQVMSGSLVFSLVGGMVLHMGGVGFGFDKWLGKTFTQYESREEMEERFWQQPNKGRLVGNLDIDNQEMIDFVILFRDIDGKLWRVNVSELQAEDREVLVSHGRLKILGQKLMMESSDFHACGVFPWWFERDYGWSELEEEKNKMSERLYKHKVINEMRGEKENMIGICSNHQVVNRLHFR